MVMCSWRISRLWAVEHAAINSELLQQSSAEPATSEETTENNATKAAQAFATLANRNAALAALNRYETAWDRQYSRALRRLLTLREARKKSIAANEPI